MGTTRRKIRAFAAGALVLGAATTAAADPCDDGSCDQDPAPVSVTSVHVGDVCFDDYDCFSLATTTCYSDGSCLYIERPPAGYQGAMVVIHDDGRQELVRASDCDKYCRYLMASDPGNHAMDFNPQDAWPAPWPVACDDDPELCWGG